MGSKKRRAEGSRGEGLPQVQAATIEISSRFEFPVLGIALFCESNETGEFVSYRLPYFVANIPNFERKWGRFLDAEEWTDIAYMVGNALESSGVRVTYRLEEGAILDERIT
jgi:hypothetical protein